MKGFSQSDLPYVKEKKKKDLTDTETCYLMIFFFHFWSRFHIFELKDLF